MCQEPTWQLIEKLDFGLLCRPCSPASGAGCTGGGQGGVDGLPFFSGRTGLKTAHKSIDRGVLLLHAVT